MRTYNYQFNIRDYAGDGLCHNSEPGTFGHECGKPAEYIGTNGNAFRTGFCAKCVSRGSEARAFKLERIIKRDADERYAYVCVAA